MIAELEAAGFECFTVNMGGIGVQIHPEGKIPEMENFLPNLPKN